MGFELRPEVAAVGLVAAVVGVVAVAVGVVVGAVEAAA